MATSPKKTSETSLFGNSAASTYGKHNSCNERKPLEVIRGNVQKQANVANITARHWQRKAHNTQAFKPAVCHPRAARRTLRESNLGPMGDSLYNTTMPRGLALNGKKWLYRTTDWAWKGFAGIKNTMRNTPLTPNQTRSQTPKQPPQLMKPPQITLPNPLVVASSSRKAFATIKSHLFPASWAKKPLKPVCLAIARLRPNESAALAMKESHLFPTWWANPQKTSETSVFGNSAASA